MALAPKGEDWKEKGKGSKEEKTCIWSKVLPHHFYHQSTGEKCFRQSFWCLCLELPIRFLATNTKLDLNSMT